jgi:23S rRNA pseudouridine2605 synthase
MRLHKLLAQHGFGSRREIERWMLEGRIVLNGAPALPGASYSSGDRVAIDGRDISGRLKVTVAPKVILYNKPQGQPIAAEGEGDFEGKSLIESLPAVRGARWLVINTMQAGDSGLMVLTSDGRLADALRRRAETIPAAYVARVLVPTVDFDVATLPRVVNYDDATIEFESIEPAGGEGTNRWFRVESHRFHRRAAVRALFESRGLQVSRVIQVKFADIELPRQLPRGKHRALSQDRVDALYALAGIEPPAAVEEPDRPPDRRRQPKPQRARSGAKPRSGSATKSRDSSKARGGRRPTGSRKSGR